VTALSGRRGVRAPAPAGVIGAGAAGAIAAAGACGLLIGRGHAIEAAALLVTAIAGVVIMARPEQAVLGLVAAMPFLVYPLSTGGLSLFVGLPLALLVSASLLARTGGRAGRPVAVPAIAFGVLVLVASASAGLSAEPRTSLSRVLYLAAFGLLAWALARAISRGLVSSEKIVRAVVIGAAAASVGVIWQFLYGLATGRGTVTHWLNGHAALFGGQHAAEVTQTNANWFVPSLNVTRGIFPFMAAPSAGQYLMIGLLAAVWLRRRYGPARRGGVRWQPIAFALIAAGLLFTFSRQAWLGAIVGVVLLGLDRRRIGFALVILCAGLAVALLPAPGGGGSTFGDYLLSSGDTTTTSSATRVGLWKQAVDLAGRGSPLGVGPGLVGTLNPDTTKNVFYAHNVMLDEVLELGFVGAFALAAVLLGGMRIAWRNRAPLAFAAIGAYVTAGMFDDVLYFPRNGFLLAVFFALAAVVPRREPQPARSPARPRHRMQHAPARPRAPRPAAAVVAAGPALAERPAPAPRAEPAPPPEPEPPAPEPEPESEPEPVAALMLGKGWFPDQEGGLNRYFRSLLEARAAEPRAVVVGPGRGAPDGVVVVSSHSRPVPWRLYRYTRAALARAPQSAVVDAHFSMFAFLPVLLGLGGAPLVVHFHGPWADEGLAAGESSRLKRAVRRAVERHVYRRADAVVVLSEAFGDLLVKRYGVKPGKVRVVRPGVALDEFRPGDRAAARRRLGVDGGRPLLVTARRLVPRMGIAVLLEAMSRLGDEGARPLLLVAGDGPERPRLEALASRLDLGDSVRFLGKVPNDELVACYQAADLAVVPSLALEGFGLVTLEALACGTPVIATAVGGLPEALTGLEPGLIVPANDARALADRIACALDGTEPPPSPERCRAYAEEFTWERTAARVEAVYREVARSVAIRPRQ
jgi:glycosyltransferase involved in cell wall biosynthesis/O-antigen ligase